MTNSDRRLQILGTRGIPASHGGFETFAERLSLYLVERGWSVTVYCQDDEGKRRREATWRGIQLVHIPVKLQGSAGTLEFDLKATLAAAKQGALVLTLGYNSALFNSVFRIRRVPNLINMDGLEWKRDKWGPVAKAWFYLNERLGCLFGDHLIADHPNIASHLATRTRSDKITMIPYGADAIEQSPASLLEFLDLESGAYVVVIARPEPENSILQVVEAFSMARRNLKLVVLGDFTPEKNAYHAKVQNAASDEVIFPGAIYDQAVVAALRFHARLYVHGHTVGGTNPSLVEAMGAASAILAHDNVFNRWVTGNSARYFDSSASCAAQFDALLDSEQTLAEMSASTKRRFEERFQWDEILAAYASLLAGQARCT